MWELKYPISLKYKASFMWRIYLKDTNDISDVGPLCS
jgi:hypothetical protein